MTKSEFIEFLEKKAIEREHISHWQRASSNSDDFWNLYRPFVDWMEDEMDLRVDDVVKISWDRSFYYDSEKVFETTYEGFAQNYILTL